MNVLLLAGTLWFTYKIAQHFKFMLPWLAPVMVMVPPIMSWNTLSGLTEPLFAFWLIASIYFTIHRPVLGVLLLSFLPVVRSEGWIVMVVYVVYMLTRKQWKWLPYLLVGQIVLSIAGAYTHHDLFWVFSKNPYAATYETYGKGPLDNFWVNMPSITTMPFRFFIAVGLADALWRTFLWLRGDKTAISREEFYLVYGVSVAYFTAHSLFWYLGIFKSFGLLRVLVGIVPTMALIATRAIDWPLRIITPYFKPILLLTPFILLPVLIKNYYQTSTWKSHFLLRGDQIAQDKAIQSFFEKTPDAAQYTFYYSSVQPSMTLPIDHFDTKKRRDLSQLFSGDPIPEKIAILWEPVYAPVESRIALDKIMNDKRFRLWGTFQAYDYYYYRTAYAYLFVWDRDQYKIANTLQFNDFEKSVAPAALDSIQPYSGKYEVKLHPGYQFAPGMDTKLNSFQPHQKIRISFMMRMPEISRNEWENPQLILAAESSGKAFAYEGIPVAGRLQPNNEWTKIEHIATVPPAKTPEDRYKVYLWNSGPFAVFLDDFKVELLQ
jgi:hypothetical protein